MNLQLCTTFPALSPFAVRRERAVEVFALVRRINTQPETEGGRKVDKKGRIRRPAGDNWF